MGASDEGGHALPTRSVLLAEEMDRGVTAGRRPCRLGRGREATTAAALSAPAPTWRSCCPY